MLDCRTFRRKLDYQVYGDHTAMFTNGIRLSYYLVLEDSVWKEK